MYILCIYVSMYLYIPFTKEKVNFNIEQARKNTIVFEEGKDDKTGAQLGWQHEQQFIMRERYRDESYVSVTISRVIGFKESTCKGEGAVSMKDQVGSRVIKRTGGLSSIYPTYFQLETTRVPFYYNVYVEANPSNFPGSLAYLTQFHDTEGEEKWERENDLFFHNLIRR